MMMMMKDRKKEMKQRSMSERARTTRGHGVLTERRIYRRPMVTSDGHNPLILSARVHFLLQARVVRLRESSRVKL